MAAISGTRWRRSSGRGRLVRISGDSATEEQKGLTHQQGERVKKGQGGGTQVDDRGVKGWRNGARGDMEGEKRLLG